MKNTVHKQQWHMIYISRPKWCSAVKYSKKHLKHYTPQQSHRTLLAHPREGWHIYLCMIVVGKIVPSNHPMQFVGLKHLTKFLPQHNLLLQFLDYEVLEVVYMLGAAHGSKKRSAGSFSSCTCRSKGAPPEFTDLKWISAKDFQGGLRGKQKNVLQYPFANKGLIFKGTEISCHKMEVRSEIIHFFL